MAETTGNIGLKEQLRGDLSAAMKQRNNVVVGALRMALSAVSTEEVSGKQARELTDDEVRKVLAKETKKRDEAAEAFAAAGRTEQAEAEKAESAILREYLPAQLADAELGQLVAEAVSEVRAQLGEQPGMKQMGQVMKAATAKIGDRADGKRVAEVVKSTLQSS